MATVPGELNTAESGAVDVGLSDGTAFDVIEEFHRVLPEGTERRQHEIIWPQTGLTFSPRLHDIAGDGKRSTTIVIARHEQARGR